MSSDGRSLPPSAWIGIGVLGLVVLIEIVLVIEPAPENTLSNILRAWAVVGLAAPFGWGTLAGHFFHPVDSSPPGGSGGWDGVWKVMLGRSNPFLVIVVTAGVIALLALVDTTVALATDGIVFPDWVSPLMLGVGFVWGALSWPA
jgi:hypothetical protein